MHIKKFLIFIFSLISLIFVSSKVDAITISECDYGEDLKLLLPVTIGVEIEGLNNYYFFQEIHNTYVNEELFVYNKSTCEFYFDVPVDNGEYTYQYSYYYQYNETKSYVPFIGKGIYKEVDLTKPIITSYFGDTFIANVDKLTELDELSGSMSATDERDGNIIPEITFDNYTSNYNKIGIYSVIFEACDYSNNCSNFILKINVKDFTPPTIVGENNISSYMSNPIKLNDITKELVAIDNHDGDISSKIFLVESNYNPDKSGTYYAYFSVKDSSNNQIKSNYKVTINVIDDIPPTIEGPTIFTSHLSSPLQSADILSQFIISDNCDLHVYKNLYVTSDTYSNNINKIGTYNMIIGAYDTNGNDSLPYIIEIIVIDDVLPIIDGENLYETYLSSPISLLEIKSNLIVYDNYDGNLFNKLEIQEDNYTINKNNIGIYHIGFVVKDSSYNISSPFIVEIQVFDDVVPLIEGTNMYNVLTSEKIDLKSIQLNLKAYDNLDGDISDKIVLNEDFYTDNYNKEGTYFLIFYVSDKSGNISNMFKVKIIVSEELSYLESINNSYLYFDTTNIVNEGEIFNILSINYEDYHSISTLENNYTHNYNTAGKYKIIYQLESMDYSVSTLTINIITVDKQSPEVLSTYKSSENKKETIFTKIISFISNIFSTIGSFFKKLFN